MQTDPPETEYITTAHVTCDGGDGVIGHPRIYLTVDPETGFVECPYCDKRFVLTPGTREG